MSNLNVRASHAFSDHFDDIDLFRKGDEPQDSIRALLPILAERVELQYEQDSKGTTPDKLVGKWAVRVAPVVRYLYHKEFNGMLMSTSSPICYPDRSYMRRAVKIVSVDLSQRTISILRKVDDRVKQHDLLVGKTCNDTEEQVLSKDYWNNNWMEVDENYSTKI